MKTELKPCPFCGKPLHENRSKYNPNASCKTEGCKGKQLPVLNLDMPEDIAAWNTRAIDSPAEVLGGPVRFEMIYKNATAMQFINLPSTVSTEARAQELVRECRFGGVTATYEPLYKRLLPAPSDSAQTVSVPAELFQRVVARLEKAQIFDLTKELKSAQKPIGGEQPAMQTLQDVDPEWKECLRILEMPNIDEELSDFADDPTGDNAVRLVRSVIAASNASPQAPTSDAVAQPVECEPLVLKGVGKSNGDGWKDTTEIGQEVLAWNTELQNPYAAGQFPRIGNAIWSASTSQYDFTPLNLAEARSAIDSLIASARFEFLDENATLRQQLAAAQQEAKEYRQQLEGPAISRAQQQSADSKPAGVVVPDEPTSDMTMRGAIAGLEHANGKFSQAGARAVYLAMLAASPTASPGVLGNVVIAGDEIYAGIDAEDAANCTVKNALVIQFRSEADFRTAWRDHHARFTVFETPSTDAAQEGHF